MLMWLLEAAVGISGLLVVLGACRAALLRTVWRVEPDGVLHLLSWCRCVVAPAGCSLTTQRLFPPWERISLPCSQTGRYL
jgi:hypothetical protein